MSHMKLQVRGRFSLIPTVAPRMQLPRGARESCQGLLDSWICFFDPLVTCHLPHSSQSYNFSLGYPVKVQGKRQKGNIGERSKPNIVPGVKLQLLPLRSTKNCVISCSES